jgi:hypothetical protein
VVAAAAVGVVEALDGDTAVSVEPVGVVTVPPPCDRRFINDIPPDDDNGDPAVVEVGVNEEEDKVEFDDIDDVNVRGGGKGVVDDDDDVVVDNAATGAGPAIAVAPDAGCRANDWSNDDEVAIAERDINVGRPNRITITLSLLFVVVVDVFDDDDDEEDTGDTDDDNDGAPLPYNTGDVVEFGVLPNDGVFCPATNRICDARDLAWGRARIRNGI